MSRRRSSVRPVGLQGTLPGALLLALALGLPAQDQGAAPSESPSTATAQQAHDLARSLIAALAPERDDPDATVQALLEAALAQRRSPAAATLAAAANDALRPVADPSALLEWLDAKTAEQPGDAPMHGLLRQELQQLRRRLQVRLGQEPPGDAAGPGWPTEVAVVGPFGDAGSHYLDEPFPPDAGFPAAGQRLHGRFGDVTPRRLRRDPDRRDFDLGPKGLSRPGCYYLLWRVTAGAATSGFLEVDYRGPFAAFIDGVEVGRFDPHREPGSTTRRLPVRLQQGEHAVVVKTGDDSNTPLRLRLIDAAGAPLAPIDELPPAPAEAADTAVAGRLSPPLREPGTGSDGAPRGGAVFRDGLQTFVQAADDLDRSGQPAADMAAAALLRVAAAWVARGDREVDRCLSLLRQLEDRPPEDAEAQLVLAEVLRRTTELPEEQRTAQALDLEKRALEHLPEHHHEGLMATVRQLEDQDQREQALRRLRAAIAAGRAGPSTYARTHAVVRRLRFEADEAPLLAEWTAACPGDARPCIRRSELASQLGDPAGALDAAVEAFARQPDDEGTHRLAFRLLLDQGRFDEARRELDRVMPATDPPSLRRLRALVALARRDADPERLRAVIRQATAHPDADAETWSDAAELWIELGDDAAALTAVDRSLDLEPDQPVLWRLRERLGGAAAPGRDFARFRRDGDAAIAAFEPGPDERTASSTMVIDQRLVELLPDGAAVVEVHELRRINDQQGVEAWRSADDPASADELLLLRTVSADGKTYVPARVEGRFAMPRLEPGAFIEWRYRNRVRAPGADPLRLGDFLFASFMEPLHVTEYVLITPDGVDGELRSRNLDVPIATVVLDGGRTAHQVVRERVDRLPEEESPPPANLTIPMVGFGEDASPWPGLRRQRAAMLWRTRPTPPIEAFARELVGDAADDGERLRRIHDFCQREIADGRGGDATEVLLRRNGSAFTLAVALLRAAGVPIDTAAAPAVRPELDSDGVPLFAEADVARLPCVRVRPRGGAPVWLFVDSPRYWPLDAVPAHRGGVEAFLVDDTAATPVRLPAAAGAVQQLRVQGTCAVTDDAVVVDAELRVGDHAGFAIADQLRKRTADVSRIAARQIGQQFFAGWRVRDAEPVGLEPGGEPLTIRLQVQDAGPQQADPERWLLSLPMPPSELRRSFGDRDERTLPLQVRSDLDFHHRLVVDPGEGRAVPDLPPPLLVSFGPLDYHLTFARRGSRVLIDRRLRLQPGTVELSLYPQWIELLSRIDRREQERLELVRTAR